jgi:hypothetical protein
MNDPTPLENLLRHPVSFTPPTPSSAFARGVMDRLEQEGRPRGPARRSLWFLAAASLAAAAGLHFAVRSDDPGHVAKPPPASVHSHGGRPVGGAD